MWNLSPPPGFQGLRSDKPLYVYHRHMPHWRQEGATYFVTFRLGDSLPQAKLDELTLLRSEWERVHPHPRSNDITEKFAREIAERVEHWLDQGHGSCILRHSKLSAFVVETLHHFDMPLRSEFDGLCPFNAHTTPDGPSMHSPTPRYELGCYVVMPNHVHAILRPLDGKTHPLENIIGSWKQFSAGKINKVAGFNNIFWQDEAFDRIIRDEEHLWRVIQYIGRNPARSHLSRDSCRLWIRPNWKSLGWTFES